MAYKTILTVVTDPNLKASALEQAITLASREDAHLDILCLGVDRTQMGYYYAGTNAMLMQETLQKAQEDAVEIQKAVKKRMAAETIRWSSEAAVAQIAGLAHLVSHRARFTDLVVMPKPYGPDKGIEDEAALEAAMFDGHAPVLVVPVAADTSDVGKRIVIAWNESAEALMAIRAAIPMLRAADYVNIAVIDPPQHGPDRSDPGGLLSQMLGRHGIKSEIAVLAKTMPRIADVLSRHVQDIDADLIVMGAYGHSRFREAILGGATRNMLEKAEVPVLMAH
ncbi:universal stress protein [Actibacterium lipolyticum]|uniref:universal stress protein n=1 Tax=Actibacterium lipolyticum TaxID=1524263 RepID=UPI000BB4553D|nr:universal stress protein [Actibacterium lipolyticum]